MDRLFLVVLIAETLFGIGFVLAPAVVMGPLGVAVDDVSAPFARLLGSAMVSYPVLLWFARRSRSLEFRQGAVYCLFTYFLVSALLLVMTQLSGAMNALGWGLVAVHAAFAAWFGYFVVRS